MSDERMNDLIDEVRRSYNAPEETPREVMWDAIVEGIEALDSEGAGGAVIDLEQERKRRKALRPAMWAAAAAAILAVGIGIGRGTAPVVDGVPMATPAAANRAGLELVAQEHLGRTESLLTMVRADARTGGLDPMAAGWARELLSETRMLMDLGSERDPAVNELLEDLELVLIQIVGVGEMGSTGDPRATTELQLTLQGLEDGEVLPRIQAALPNTMAGA